MTVPATNTSLSAHRNLLTGTYGQTNNVITVNIASNGLLPGNAAYLVFTTGGAANGLYFMVATNSTTQFTISTPDGATRAGNCLLPKISAGGYVQSGTNITVSCAGPHGLVTNETIYIPANTVLLAPGQYQVIGIPDPLHFTFTRDFGQSDAKRLQCLSARPAAADALRHRHVQQSTWNMSYTDSGTVSSLSQSPLRSPTVFNFFYPGYEFPGVLASAGLTTPEFQLTTDSGVAAQMNFIEGGILENTGNTNGLSSFTGGNGSIVLNLAPWMTTNYTANAGIPTLVSNLNTLLAAGQLSARRADEHHQLRHQHVNFSSARPRPRRRCATAFAPSFI